MFSKRLNDFFTKSHYHIQVTKLISQEKPEHVVLDIIRDITFVESAPFLKRELEKYSATYRNIILNFDDKKYRIDTCGLVTLAVFARDNKNTHLIISGNTREISEQIRINYLEGLYRKHNISISQYPHADYSALHLLPNTA
ncbi:MAG: hypothetical protein Q7S74_00885 [Nanoarchaeota archaeon]|nr:hypothetical protein [Nanoarchaeota archaeon]